MTKDEALRMALVALENIYDGFKTSPRAQYTAITAIKEALADHIGDAAEFVQPEQVKYRRGDWLRCLETDDVCVIHMSGSANQWVKFPDGDVLSFKNAQVAELFDKINKERDWEGIAADQAMTIALMKSEQEPAFWLNEQGQLSATRGFAERHSIGQKIIPLYTAPPKREWIELEAEHMDEITSTAISMVAAMLMTEDKLKELNE